MIWIDHDFLSNFNGSVASGDTDMTLSIFKSELSDLLVYKTDKLFELFDKLEIKYKKNESYEKILEKILNEITINAKFVRGLAFLIAQNNDVVKSKDWKSSLDKIVKGIRKVNNGFINNPKSKKLFEKGVLDMIATKYSKSGFDGTESERKLNKKDYTVLWIVGIAVVGIGTYLLYEYLRKRRIEKALALGDSVKMETGGIPPPTEVPPPSATQPPVPEIVTPPKPTSNDPAFNVGSDVLLPEVPVTPPQTTVVVNTGNPQAVNQTPVNQVGQKSAQSATKVNQV